MDFANLSTEARIDFIESLELPAVMPLITPRSSSLKMNPLGSNQGDKESAAVVGNNVLSFVAGLAPQLKQDVMDSVLFAQLATEKACPNQDTHYIERYNMFSNIMTTCGWTKTDRPMYKVEDLQQKLTMDQVALEIIASAVSPNKAILDIVAKVFGALSKNPKALGLFESAAKGVSSANFRILPCIPTDDGEVIMIKACMQFSSVKKITKVLFWEWSKNEVDLYASGDNVTLNRKMYADVRDAISRAMRVSVLAKIEKIDI